MRHHVSPLTPSIIAEPTTVAKKQMGTLALKIREPSVTSVTANSCSKGVTCQMRGGEVDQVGEVDHG